MSTHLLSVRADAIIRSGHNRPGWPLERGLPGPEEGIRLAFLAASYRKQGKEKEADEVLGDLARGLKVCPFWDGCAAFKEAYQEARAMAARNPKTP
jgi:hypothetical protein